MYPHDIIFKLNDSARLVIDLNIPFKTLPCFCQTTIVFYDGEREYILNLDEDLETGMDRFSDILSKSLNGEMYLHESLTKDLGYLHNEYFKYVLNDDEDRWQLNPHLAYDEDEVWVGYKYQLWSCGKCAAWIYNDERNNIVFELTPRYPGFFPEKERPDKIPLYNDWMKKYCYFFRSVVPRDIAQQWLIQANEMIDHMKKEFDRKSQQASKSDKMIYEECPQNKKE